MKKLLLLFIGCFSMLNTFAQPAGMLDETFNLKFIETDNIYYTPNGENPDLIISENAGNYVINANGIFNS